MTNNFNGAVKQLQEGKNLNDKDIAPEKSLVQGTSCCKWLFRGQNCVTQK